MQKLLVALLVALFAMPTAGFAQTQPGDVSRDRTLRPPTLQWPAGFMRESGSRDSVRLAALPPALRQAQPRKRSWPGRHPVLFGALVGAGVGIGVEAAVIPGASGGEPHSVYLPMFSVLGAGIGSLVGLIVSARRK